MYIQILSLLAKKESFMLLHGAFHTSKGLRLKYFDPGLKSLSIC